MREMQLQIETLRGQLQAEVSTHQIFILPFGQIWYRFDCLELFLIIQVVHSPQKPSFMPKSRPQATSLSTFWTHNYAISGQSWLLFSNFFFDLFSTFDSASNDTSHDPLRCVWVFNIFQYFPSLEECGKLDLHHVVTSFRSQCCVTTWYFWKAWTLNLLSVPLLLRKVPSWNQETVNKSVVDFPTLNSISQ